MSNYDRIARNLIDNTRAFERNLPLRHAVSGSQFFLQSYPTEKVCLFFHGFTAAPYQYIPMGERLYRAGYNILAPLMPGHGRAGNWGSGNPPPLPTDPQTYQKFALEWLDLARSFGKQIIIGGISGGGALAAWLSLQRPYDIHRVLLFAPYLRSSSRILDILVRQFDFYFAWVQRPGFERLAYDGFALPALEAMLDIGRDVQTRADRQLAAPSFIISSDSDLAVDKLDHRALFEDLKKRQPKTWYYSFSSHMNVPHTMMTKREGNEYEQLLITMTKSFIESELTWDEVEEIAYRMTKGRTFNSVVAELGLNNKVSPDLPATITMLDKRAIAIAREQR